MLLVNPNTVLVNGDPVAVSVKPKWKRGVPKVNVKTATVGDKVKVYEEIDYSEAMGQATFSIQPTAENIELIEGWQDNIGKNAIRYLDSRTGLTKTFNSMTLADDIDIDPASDIEIVFIGGQAS